MDAATAALKDSARVVMGMMTAWSQASTVLALSPCPSFPMTTQSPAHRGKSPRLTALSESVAAKISNIKRERGAFIGTTVGLWSESVAEALDAKVAEKEAAAEAKKNRG